MYVIIWIIVYDNLDYFKRHRGNNSIARLLWSVNTRSLIRNQSLGKNSTMMTMQICYYMCIDAFCWRMLIMSTLNCWGGIKYDWEKHLLCQSLSRDGEIKHSNLSRLTASAWPKPVFCLSYLSILWHFTSNLCPNAWLALKVNACSVKKKKRKYWIAMRKALLHLKNVSHGISTRWCCKSQYAK